MRLQEALDRTGVIIKDRSLIKSFEEDDKTLYDWIYLFACLHLL